jgi:hypothetical protein
MFVCQSSFRAVLVFMLKLKSSQIGLGLCGAIAALGLVQVPEVQANPYNACIQDLTNAKLNQDPTKDLMIKGCAEALHPDQVGTCVSRISSPTDNPIAAAAALDACRRVRRPLDLATCVGDIRNADAQAPMMDVLDSCRRSLLPERFGQCVVGLRNKPLEQPIAQNLTSCLDASDYRKDVQLRPLSDLLAPYVAPIEPIRPQTPVPTPSQMPSQMPPSAPTPQLF